MQSLHSTFLLTIYDRIRWGLEGESSGIQMRMNNKEKKKIEAQRSLQLNEHGLHRKGKRGDANLFVLDQVGNNRKMCILN